MTRLQVKASQIGKILTNLEHKFDKEHEESLKKSPSGNLGHHPPPNKVKKVTTIQQIPPFNPNSSRFKKSPSAEMAQKGEKEEGEKEKNEKEKSASIPETAVET